MTSPITEPQPSSELDLEAGERLLALPEWTNAVLRYANRHKSLREWEHVADVIEALMAALKAERERTTYQGEMLQQAHELNAEWEQRYEECLQASERLGADLAVEREVNVELLTVQKALAQRVTELRDHANAVEEDNANLLDHRAKLRADLEAERAQLNAAKEYIAKKLELEAELRADLWNWKPS